MYFSSSTFKDPERASLRDSGHGDSDQADSDQDTNKGSCCDMSVREALKMKTTSTKSQPLEQGEWSFPMLTQCKASAVVTNLLVLEVQFITVGMDHW